MADALTELANLLCLGLLPTPTTLPQSISFSPRAVYGGCSFSSARVLYFLDH